jgi:ubiquinone/menaquinone biosynthesis C-methylase UbiE
MSGAPNGAITFDNAPEYERFMGDWSRAAGAAFLDWLAPARGVRWLEIGCGTGAFTELVYRKCAPRTLVAIDPSATQIEYCRRQSIGERVEFQTGDATALPYTDGCFDVVAHALVLNFIPDAQLALHEMRRVGRSGGLGAGYVWDFGAERAPNSCIAAGLRELGCSVPRMPGMEKSSLGSLRESFERAGFTDITTARFDVCITFSDFDEFWRSQTPSFSPLSGIINALSRIDHMKLVALVRSRLTVDRAGAIRTTARANAIKARTP